MSSPGPRRFQTHDRVLVSEFNATGERMATGGPNLASIGMKSTLSGGSGSFAVTLEKAGLSVHNRTLSVERTQAHPGIARQITGEEKPRPRNGASVRKVAPVDDFGHALTSSPSSMYSRTLSPTASPIMKARLLSSESRPTTPPLESDKVGVVIDSPAKRAVTNGLEAAQFVLALDDVSKKSAAYSPRTQLLLRVRQAKEQQIISKQSKLKPKLARSASYKPSSTEEPTVVAVDEDAPSRKFPTKMKITAKTLQEIRKRPEIPKFGQRHPRAEDPCVLVLLWRVWRKNREEAKRKRRELMKLLNSPVFVDGPCGHVVNLCGCMCSRGCSRSLSWHCLVCSNVCFARLTVTKPQMQEFARMYHLDFQLECVLSFCCLCYA